MINFIKKLFTKETPSNELLIHAWVRPKDKEQLITVSTTLSELYGPTIFLHYKSKLYNGCEVFHYNKNEIDVFKHDRKILECMLNL